MTLSLRPYQRSAIEALYEYFSASAGNPLVVLPTGTGKSLCIAGFTREAIAAYGDTRVLILTHVKELIQQNFMALLRACRAGSEEGVQVDTAPEAASSALGVIRSISARLALKASRIDMVHLSLIHFHCSVFDAASLTRYTDGHAEIAAK